MEDWIVNNLRQNELFISDYQLVRSLLRLLSALGKTFVILSSTKGSVISQSNNKPLKIQTQANSKPLLPVISML